MKKWYFFKDAGHSGVVSFHEGQYEQLSETSQEVYYFHYLDTPSPQFPWGYRRATEAEVTYFKQRVILEKLL